MKTCIFDTETTGFPRYKVPLDHYSQPHLVQLGMILEGVDHPGRESFLVRCPIGIPAEATNVHGITTKQALEEGAEIEDVLGAFELYLANAERLVAHNMKFDQTIMRIAYRRLGREPKLLNEIPKVCTMRSASKFFIAQGWGSKWPKLQEAYRKLIDEHGFEGAHNAVNDSKACWEILRALEDNGVSLVEVA